MEASLLVVDPASWPAEVDRLRAQLGAPHNPHLFPRHFLQATFPRMGGLVVQYCRGTDLVGAAFLFPRCLEAGRRIYTLRYHSAASGQSAPEEEIVRLTQDLLGEAGVVFYDPRQEQPYERSAWPFGAVELGRPDGAEAVAIRHLQQTIWRCDADQLYPADIHSPAFCAGTSLVARQGGRLCGFLFGFFQFGGSLLPPAWRGRIRDELRIESQLLGVAPAFRGQGIAFLLKRAQAEQARRDGVDVIHWTVDPLQYANAALNFGKLRALAFRFHPDYYPVRNELNQVPASRLEVTWLVGTRRVCRALAGSPEAPRYEPAALPRVNDGPEGGRLDCTEPALAIEVPADWTACQRQDRRQALRWRETTDALLAHYLGCEEGKYALTDVGQEAGRRYLIAERVEAEMLARYAAAAEERR